MKQNVVTNWFGKSFSKLHPLLQTLHQVGGELHGKVKIEYGRGMAGWIGHRIAKKLGIPKRNGFVRFRVEIKHSKEALLWSRTFQENNKMCSEFKPKGTYPNGYWIEKTGFLTVELYVKIQYGGWYWIPKRMKIGWLPLPLWLMPKTEAYKTIKENQYVFKVSVSLPIVGKLVTYQGTLTPLSLGAPRLPTS